MRDDPRRKSRKLGGRSDLLGGGALQLRDSDGFAPLFSRFLQRLCPAETKMKGCLRYITGNRWMSIDFISRSADRRPAFGQTRSFNLVTLTTLAIHHRADVIHGGGNSSLT